MDSMSRLEQIVARLPEATRVDVEEWGGHPTFRVRGKNFVFSDLTAEHLSVKLPVAGADDASTLSWIAASWQSGPISRQGKDDAECVVDSS